MEPLTNITHYSLHIIQFGFSQNMLIISLPKLGRKLHYPHTKPNIIWHVGKTQRKPKFQKSHHYDVANSKYPTTMCKFKTRYDAALLTKIAMMQHYLQSLLLHGNTLQNLKIIFTKPKFLLGIYFHKAQILIWNLFSQSPNSNLALFYKA